MEKQFYLNYAKLAERLATQYNVKIREYDQRDQISFTPYIYNVCSANCRFCSEKLVRDGNVMVCGDLVGDYRLRLLDVFDQVKKRPLFLSLSGKEPTESPQQLETILQCANLYDNITDRVMYTNLSGFGRDFQQLRDIIVDGGLTRIECSRHHYDEDVNQAIMNFRNRYQIKTNECFENTVRQLLPLVDLKMVCVIQKTGVKDYDDIIKYIQFARRIGVKNLVFRELAMFDDSIEDGVTTKYIEENRIEIMEILQALDKEAFQLTNITKGYYYFSFGYKYQGEMNVSFEMSDYEEMISKHYGDKIYKLILYPNGKLCTDWNMKGEIELKDLRL